MSTVSPPPLPTDSILTTHVGSLPRPDDLIVAGAGPATRSAQLPPEG